MIGDGSILPLREECRANVGAVERNGSVTIFRHRLYHSHGATKAGPQNQTPDLHEYKTCFQDILEILASGMIAEKSEECSDIIENVELLEEFYSQSSKLATSM